MPWTTALIRPTYRPQHLLYYTHCSSFSSQRPAIAAFGVAQSTSRMTLISAAAIYETRSRCPAAMSVPDHP